jgi:hypothetical protein
MKMNFVRMDSLFPARDELFLPERPAKWRRENPRVLPLRLGPGASQIPRKDRSFPLDRQ